MLKLLTLLCFILAVSSAELQNVSTYAATSYNSSVLHTDAYINLNNQQHEKNVQDYENQIEIFKQNYDASLNTIQVEGDMLIDNLNQANERWTSLKVLSELSGKCVNKYISSIPKISAIKSSINGCINTAKQQITYMLSSPVASKTYLESYYNGNYENGLKSCKNKFNTDKYYLNYTLCVVDVSNDADSYTINNQKTFASQMDTARCSAETNIKKALDCSYAIQNKTISQIAEANTLINKCLLGQDDCKKCSASYQCPFVTYMDKTDVSYSARVMSNPFYDRPELKNCLLFKLY